MSASRVEEVIRDLAAVLKKHNCLIASPDNRLTLILAEIIDAGDMKGRTLAALSFVTPRSSEYMLRDSSVALRWSDNTPVLGTRELEVVNKRSVIEHI